jgi:hypothetical protein
MLLKRIVIIVTVLYISGAAADSYDELLSAIKQNDISAAEAQFARGMDVNTADPDANTLLMIAVRENHLDLVKRLLERQVKIGARNRYGETALMLGAGKGIWSW